MLAEQKAPHPHPWQSNSGPLLPAKAIKVVVTAQLITNLKHERIYFDHNLKPVFFFKFDDNLGNQVGNIVHDNTRYHCLWQLLLLSCKSLLFGAPQMYCVCMFVCWSVGLCCSAKAYTAER